MSEWTQGSLFWFAVAIIVPGVMVHFALGRKGGHHLFDLDNLSVGQIRNLPFEMAKKNDPEPERDGGNDRRTGGGNAAVSAWLPDQRVRHLRPETVP